MATAKKSSKKMPAKKTAPAKGAVKKTPTKKAPAKKPATASAPTSTARALLSEGSPAPDFTLPSSDGGDVSLRDLRGKNVVVYFYPKDDTPGCTVEAQGFRDARAELERRNAIVLGVSKDSVASHCRFRDKHGLDFPLLSDPDGRVIEAYGAWGEKSMYGKTSMGIIRSTVVIAPDGTVKKVFPKVKVDGHVADVLAAIDAS